MTPTTQKTLEYRQSTLTTELEQVVNRLQNAKQQVIDLEAEQVRITAELADLSTDLSAAEAPTPVPPVPPVGVVGAITPLGVDDLETAEAPAPAAVLDPNDPAFTPVV